MKRIKLSKGQYATVDDQDFDWLNQWSWHYSSNGYAMRVTYIKGSGRQNQKNEYVLMHRAINKTPAGKLTDHINRDKLDNRRSNLRNADKSLNSINRPLQSNNKSGYKGIHWFKRISMWQVYINKKGKRVNLGYYQELSDAIKVRQEAENRLH